MIAVSAAAAFLATFNETFLNVALSPIMEDLQVSVDAVQWLATGYLLVAAIFVPVSNVLYRRYSTRPLFVVALALLVAGSVVGAFQGAVLLVVLTSLIGIVLALRAYRARRVTAPAG